MKLYTKSIFISLLFAFSVSSNAQDTFSIVAVDSVTGEVGSAGASCVDLTNYPGYTYHFLGELIPGVGAINTQAYYLAGNQLNARNKMLEGLSPSEIIEWLEANDIQNNPSIRQYGIAGFVGGSPQAAGYTGVNTDDYKNHVTGPNYSIQGNILLGQEVLDQMEANFLSEEGDLACKLMAALQGANMVGADTRCASNGSSSLFSFVKVAQPDDVFGDPSFVLGLKTASGAGIEPIDSLQVLFDEVHYCPNVGLEETKDFDVYFTMRPNPATNTLTLENTEAQVYWVKIADINGKVIMESSILHQLSLDISEVPQGLYFVQIYNNEKSFVKKLIKK
jgi:uncharacterized Ntn-hydrolase superfamily protein